MQEMHRPRKPTCSHVEGMFLQLTFQTWFLGSISWTVNSTPGTHTHSHTVDQDHTFTGSRHRRVPIRDISRTSRSEQFFDVPAEVTGAKRQTARGVALSEQQFFLMSLICICFSLHSLWHCSNIQLPIDSLDCLFHCLTLESISCAVYFFLLKLQLCFNSISSLLSLPSLLLETRWLPLLAISGYNK